MTVFYREEQIIIMHSSCTDCSGEKIHETVCEKQSWVQMGPGGFEGSGVGGMSSSQMSLWAAAVVHALCCSTDKVAKIMDAKKG